MGRPPGISKLIKTACQNCSPRLLTTLYIFIFKIPISAHSLSRLIKHKALVCEIPALPVMHCLDVITELFIQVAYASSPAFTVILFFFFFFFTSSLFIYFFINVTKGNTQYWFLANFSIATLATAKKFYLRWPVIDNLSRCSSPIVLTVD